MDDLQTTRASFTRQAGQFEGAGMNFSNRDYLSRMVKCASPQPTDAVLEAAAGSCACGRALAPFAGHVTCLDATPAMLNVGQTEAQKQGLDNMTFLQGNVEALPFAEGTFDLVVSRLALHHMRNVALCFSEMVRVLKTGGRLVLIDMQAGEPETRARKDRLETLRDPSHLRLLSQEEMLALFAQQGVAVRHTELTQMPQALAPWLALTKTDEESAQEITRCMETELCGGEKTGFQLYRNENGIGFFQPWRMIVGEKR